jgi:hypothetical protein
MSDTNFRSIADQDGVVLHNEVIDPRLSGVDPSTISDVLKFSHATNCSALHCTVDAGGLQKENAIDMNRLCNNILIQDCVLVEGKQNAITIKGGCTNIHILDTVIEMVPSSAGHCDIELGNYSEQSDLPVTGVTLEHVTRSDGGTVRVRVINADYPVVSGGNYYVYKPIWARWPIWSIYSFLRKKGIL